MFDRDEYDSEASELRAEARAERRRSRPCCECSGTLGNHVAGCPEDYETETESTSEEN